jgi:hypothetical protein
MFYVGENCGGVKEAFVSDACTTCDEASSGGDGAFDLIIEIQASALVGEWTELR